MTESELKQLKALLLQVGNYRRVTQIMIDAALEKHEGNKLRSAKSIGMSVRNLRNRIRNPESFKRDPEQGRYGVYGNADLG